MDCLEGLKQIESNTIDSIVTDPPYQLKSIAERFSEPDCVPAKHFDDGSFNRVSKHFIGKTWDKFPPVEVWKECVRDLKPGAFAFIMTTPRQDNLCQALTVLQEAGFYMGYPSLYWTYETGLPKAHHVANMLLKRVGISIPDNTKGIESSYIGYHPKPALELVLVAMKPIKEQSYIEQTLKNQKAVTWLDDVKFGGHFPSNLLVDELPTHIRETFPFLPCSKPSSSEKDIGITNIHPTVKPIELMLYLLLLGSRKHDIILDPFLGSGTTAIACKLLDRQYIGFEIEKEYYDVSIQRTESVSALAKFCEQERDTINKILHKKKEIKWF